MRILICAASVALATALVTHGVYLEREAAAARSFTTTDASSAENVVRRYPYSEAAFEARRQLVDAWAKTRPPSDAGDPFELAVASVARGFREAPPFLEAEAALVVGLGLLLLAVFLPSQRFRGLALLLLILGAVVGHPWLLDRAYVGEIAAFFAPAAVALAALPWIAALLILLGGLLIAARRPPVLG